MNFKWWWQLIIKANYLTCSNCCNTIVTQTIGIFTSTIYGPICIVIISATFQSSIWTVYRYWSTIDLEIYALYRRFLKPVGSCQNFCTGWDITAVCRPSLYSYIGAQTSKRMELTAPLTLLEKGVSVLWLLYCRKQQGSDWACYNSYKSAR
mgnify:FL=1